MTIIVMLNKMKHTVMTLIMLYILIIKINCIRRIIALRSAPMAPNDLSCYVTCNTKNKISFVLMR